MALRNVTKLPLLQRLTVQTRTLSDSFTRLNIYKDPELAPKELNDMEYPEWLWTLQDPLPTKGELLREAETHYRAGGYDAVFDNMSETNLRRLFRLDRREKIKADNDRRRGGKVV